ncbi:MAG: GTP-binding protein [Moraxellaceae bacterium]|nr:MAG: GTP-binding protein [Moraxellaceae bacterium]
MLKPIHQANAIQAVPTHIITGFLGAGKTTLLNGLLAQKPADETWAVLINEFGKIGVDQALIRQQDGIAIKEVIGGCLCCTSQLPMQVALSRLLQQTRPDRLFIEPTGLAHADQLIAQLSQTHWQTSLQLQAVVCVISAAMLLDQRYRQHSTLISQLEVSDILVISHAGEMQAAHEQAMQQLIAQYPKFKQQIYRVDQRRTEQGRLEQGLDERGRLDFKQIDYRPANKVRQRQPLLTPLPNLPANRPRQARLIGQTAEANPENLTPPFHYVEQALGHAVAGWCFPATWQFEQKALIECLLTASNWLRIKGVMHTDQGWIAINFTPTQLNYHSHDGFGDNRLEIIVSTKNESEKPENFPDWQAFEQKLLACLCVHQAE